MNLKDTKPGIIKTCQVCNSKNVYEVLDLTHCRIEDMYSPKPEPSYASLSQDERRLNICFNAIE